MGLTMTWDVSDALTLKSLTGYRDVKRIFYQDYADSFQVGFRTFDDVRFHQFSQELQALGTLFNDRRRLPARPLLLQGGRESLRERADQGRSRGSIFDPLCARQGPRRPRGGRVQGDLRAGHVDAAILDDRLELTLGGRYTKDDARREPHAAEPLPADSTPTPGVRTGAVLRLRDGVL